MNPHDFMEKTYELYAEKFVRLVAIPLPPAPVRGTIFLPQAFASRAYDYEFEVDDHIRVVSADFTKEFGPALLVMIKLKDLIHYDGDGYLTVDTSTFCAQV